MAGSTKKRVVIRRFEREPLAGYVNPASYLQPTGVELLSEGGVAAVIPFEQIKTVSFVRDFEQSGEVGRRVFNTRPKLDGLWVSFLFRDDDLMEGVMINNLLQVEYYGFTIVPPESYGNVQRVFIPRIALRSADVLGVIGSPLTKRKPKVAVKDQIGLFEE